eukprot:3579839-Pyramimonas_sp.AAC.1
MQCNASSSDVMSSVSTIAWQNAVNDIRRTVMQTRAMHVCALRYVAQRCIAMQLDGENCEATQLLLSC